MVRGLPARVVRSVARACRHAEHEEMDNMKFARSINTAVAISAVLLALSACQKQEGPAERAGKDVDKAIESAGRQIEKAGDSIQDAAKGDRK
jgi:hypothetical protein